MAQLFRVTKLNDSTHCQTFTFILPSATATDDAVEILSRDFSFGGHKWRLCLQKRDKHLSPYLQLMNISEGVQCTVDIAFALINRDSFTQNETYSERQLQFTFDEPVHGHRTFITLDDLNKRHFSDARNEFLFEITLKQNRTTFSSVIILNQSSKLDPRTKDKDALDYQRYDTKPFIFGDLEWVCVFCPNMDVLDNGSLRHMVQITRKTRLDSLCKLNYRVVLGGAGATNVTDGSKFLRTEMRQEIFDFNGNGEGIYFVDDYLRYSNGNQLKLNIELYDVFYINNLKFNVLSIDNKQPSTQCFDTDRQSWCLKMVTPPQSSTIEQQNDLTLLLTYPDYVNIPKDYLRYVSCNMRILPPPNNSSSKEPLPLDLGGPIEQFYSNFNPDQGYPVATKLKLQELKSPGNPYLDKNDHKMLVQIEWLSTYLLVHPSYHAYDEVYRKQIVQMRREIQALQTENYSLEKDLHSYQLSIADKCGSGSNTPGRTWSVSSTASNPSRLTNGGPTSQLQAKAVLAAVSLLHASEDRRSSVGLDTIPVIHDRRRSSVEHQPPLLTATAAGLLSPPRSKSGGNIQESSINGTQIVDDVNSGRLTPTMHRRTTSNVDKRRRASKDKSPRSSPPPVQRRQDAGRRSQDVTSSDSRYKMLPDSGPVERHRDYSNSISVYDQKNRTGYQTACLLGDPFLERGGERLRSRSVSDFTTAQQAMNKTNVGARYYDEQVSHPRQLQRPIDDHRHRRQPSPQPIYHKAPDRYEDKYYAGYQQPYHYD